MLRKIVKKLIREKYRYKLWDCYFYVRYKCLHWWEYPIKRKIRIMTSEETVKYIITNNCSITRLGDGELRMVWQWLEDKASSDNPAYQGFNTKLAERMYQIIIGDYTHSKLLVCYPYALRNPSTYNYSAQIFWGREWERRKHFLSPHIQNKLLGDASFTRFYMQRKDIKNTAGYVELLRKIWQDRPLLIVEGEFSRLGVGNDLFANAKSIERIICPSENAFDIYDDIYHAVYSYAQKKNYLILLALGPTATVLAADLHSIGQVIDIGHIDIEYEWFLMGVTEKVAIPNKYVNEVQDGRIQQSSILNNEYLTQIIIRIKK